MSRTITIDGQVILIPDVIVETKKMVPLRRNGVLRIEPDTLLASIEELTAVPVGGTIDVESWDYDLHNLYLIMHRQTLWTFTYMETVGTCATIRARRIRPLDPGRPRHWGVVRNWSACEVVRG